MKQKKCKGQKREGYTLSCRKVGTLEGMDGVYCFNHHPHVIAEECLRKWKAHRVARVHAKWGPMLVNAVNLFFKYDENPLYRADLKMIRNCYNRALQGE